MTARKIIVQVGAMIVTRDESRHFFLSGEVDIVIYHYPQMIVCQDLDIMLSLLCFVSFPLVF